MAVLFGERGGSASEGFVDHTEKRCIGGDFFSWFESHFSCAHTHTQRSTRSTLPSPPHTHTPVRVADSLRVVGFAHRTVWLHDRGHRDGHRCLEPQGPAFCRLGRKQRPQRGNAVDHGGCKGAIASPVWTKGGGSGMSRTRGCVCVCVACHASSSALFMSASFGLFPSSTRTYQSLRCLRHDTARQISHTHTHKHTLFPPPPFPVLPFEKNQNALVVGASLSSPRSFLVEETGVFVRAPAPLQSSLAFTTASFGSLISTVSIEAGQRSLPFFVAVLCCVVLCCVLGVELF